MSNPVGMRSASTVLENGDKVLIYSDPTRILLQLRHQVPTEQNVLDAAFKVSVELSPTEALAVASELLTLATPRLRLSGEDPEPKRSESDKHHKEKESKASSGQ